MSEDAVLYTVTDHIATLTLNRPETRNALSAEVLGGLLDQLRQANADPEVRVIVLTGSGSAFCAGGDLSTLTADVNPVEAHEQRGRYAELFRLFARLRVPVLAAVNGHAIGGGLGIVLGCDLAIAKEGATFGTPEITLGLFPHMVLASLFRNVPRKIGLEMVLLGERFDAQRALEAGIVNRVVPAAEFESTVRDWAQRLAQHSPTAIRLGREAFYRQANMTFDDALAYLHQMLTLNLLTEDAKEGIAAFLEKRKPKWSGR